MASSACHNWVRIQIAVCQQTWVDDPFAADADVVFEGRQKRSARPEQVGHSAVLWRQYWSLRCFLRI